MKLIYKLGNFEKSRLPSLMWVGLIQSVEGLKSKSEVSRRNSPQNCIINSYLNFQPANLPYRFRICNFHNLENKFLKINLDDGWIYKQKAEMDAISSVSLNSNIIALNWSDMEDTGQRIPAATRNWKRQKKKKKKKKRNWNRRGTDFPQKPPEGIMTLLIPSYQPHDTVVTHRMVKNKYLLL